ncbi:hypothetical protein SY83_17840 [Paenibacillus swuensis]|uniref:SWIM-type domain-containing protein n=1 Tax=Paenibacillus swuensis TaxID=1178515 RepID=A0A172TLK0_9BACL|nr:hypothetical protein [Paenibacillus swuensis]ANE47846.1 hypothetical protein SY83_17840 [Paenibacillus swuensis]
MDETISWISEWESWILQSLEDTKLAQQGRRLAAEQRVQQLSLKPGFVTAKVRGDKPRPFQPQITGWNYSSAAQEQWISMLWNDTEMQAQLLMNEIPSGLQVALAEKSIRLLPEASNLDFVCTCKPGGMPCEHSAALLYETANILEGDPLKLLNLRGMDMNEVWRSFRIKRGASLLIESGMDQNPQKHSNDAHVDVESDSRTQRSPMAFAEDYPVFWNKDAGLRNVLDPLYAKVRERADQLNLEMQEETQ